MKAVDGALLFWLTAHRFPLLPYSSGARGYFQKRATLGKDIVNAKFPQYDNAENDRRFAVLSALSRETGCSLTGCALAALFALRLISALLEPVAEEGMIALADKFSQVAGMLLVLCISAAVILTLLLGGTLMAGQSVVR